TGTRAKFGLTIPEVMHLATELERRGLQDALELVHIHAGSQIADVQVLKQTVKEIAQIYAALRKRGLNVRYLDVGGGLGVTYDASISQDEERINYGLQEYANAVVFGVQDVCRQQSVPEPNLVTESGRALTAHHSVLIVPVLGAVRRDRLQGELSPAVLEQPHVRDLAAIHAGIGQDARIGALLEAFHDSKAIRQDLQTLFTLGYLDIECLSASEELYWTIAREVLTGLKNLELHPPPVELIELEEGLTDQYLCNFSVFQSMLDHWAIGQVFPIMPIDRLDVAPTRRARLVDLTCDSDGKVSHYVSSHPDKSFLPLPEVEAEGTFYLGLFLMGAYQDIMGDAHNLFGRVAEAHVYADAEEEDNFWIEKVIGAIPVQDMLAQVQYFPNDLDRRMSEFVRAKIEAGVVRPSQGVEILERYRAVFPRTTYCEPNPPAAG
ncbi:MAG: biosynthetic arginine decarboxylase, partial [Pseudomonadales bacterium]|nr:biosynthetic arginine decarboxylase [Pseudomonadales bacterium]